MKAVNNNNNKKGNSMLTSEVLRRAADLSDEIAAKQNELNQLLAGNISVEPVSASRTTPEAIEKIRAAQRRRWRNVRKQAAEAQAAVSALAAQTAAPAPAPAPVVVAPAPAVVAPPTSPVGKGKPQLVTA